MPLIRVAACNLAQHSLAWEPNRDRILESIAIAKERQCAFRSGPELEISGYGLLDHFLEMDTYTHSMEMLHSILSNPATHGILLDIGLPVMHRGLRLNCRAITLDGRILLIRPKMHMAQEGNHRELRYFQPWNPHQVEQYRLPAMFHNLQGGETCPIGDSIISTKETMFGFETCEEMWTPIAPHLDLSLAGCEIIVNSSASHFSLRKLDLRIGLITEATRKCGGIYMYSNQMGLDGDRLYYDGTAMIIVNGQIVAQGSQFSLNTIEVIDAVVDLDEVRAFRSNPARGLQSVKAHKYEIFHADYSLLGPETDLNFNVSPSSARPLVKHEDVEEIALAPACYMWSYLVHSKSAGFLIPLSGGLDSASTATLVFSMCRMVFKAIEAGHPETISHLNRIAGVYGPEGWKPKSPQDICHRILHTVYLGMASQSSVETRSRAERLAAAIGAYHTDMNIDDVFQAQKSIITQATGFEPRFRVHGGSNSENLLLQNIQARSRMVTSYSMAQLLPTVRKRSGGGSLLVLGSSNVDECLRGYYTKYDCSSADINPIGSISKTDLKRFLRYAQVEFSLPIIEEFLDATPTAELEPLTENYTQSDEADMGMTYAELSIFGKLRKENKLGPFGMFQRLVHEWKDLCTPRETAQKVKHFFHCYAINRHKMTTLTPALHMEDYSPDDNRFDLRPFLLPSFYESWSFKKIDEAVARMEAAVGQK